MIPSSRFPIASRCAGAWPILESQTYGFVLPKLMERRQIPEPETLARRSSAMAYWLFKSEPEVYGFDHLLAETDRTTGWDGVRNYQARNFLRDSIKVGDGVLFYHSNADPPCIAGIAEVVRAGHPDPTAFDPRSDHHDPKSDPASPTWYQVSIRAVKTIDPPLEITTPERKLRARRHGAAPQGKPAVRSASDRTGMESHHGSGRREAKEEASVAPDSGNRQRRRETRPWPVSSTSRFMPRIRPP